MTRYGVVFLGLALAGCLDHPTPQDPRDKMLGIVCHADLMLTGTFQPGQPAPADYADGCWPDGVWTFTASVADNNCSGAPMLMQQYQVQVTVDTDNNYTYVYMNDPTYARVRLQVTAGGGGSCEGNFQIYSPDGKILTNLSPSLQAGNMIDGHGEYEVYMSDQWPY